MRLKTGLIVLMLASVPACAQVSDDRDLSGGRISPSAVPALRLEGRLDRGIRVFKAERLPGRTDPAPTTPKVFGSLALTDPDGKEFPARGVTVLLMGPSSIFGKAKTDAQGNWEIPLSKDPKGSAVVRFRLENAWWSIQDPSSNKPYEWEAAVLQLPAPGPVEAGRFRLDPTSQNGKIGFIHLQFLEAFGLFDREGVKTDWWKDRLAVRYPGSGDFFSPWGFSLDLTRPETWDVNLHELGHAVAAAGTRTHGGGGFHKIDECYNEGLAWSEGFATFFAAAVRLSRADADAKFEYLVPRRAPIRIENVPDDVCKGDKSEWRVAAGLWDLYDLHPDGADRSVLGFGRLWGSIQGKSMGSFKDAWNFVSRALSPAELALAKGALEQNTLLPPPPAIRQGSTRILDLIDGTAAPDWDGVR